MLKRVYAHNYKCLQNFEFKVSNDECDKHNALLIGKNGAGKSTIADVLRIFQSIGRGNSNLLLLREGVQKFAPVVSSDDFSFGRTDAPMRLEIDVEIDGKWCLYLLELELPPKFSALRVKTEKLTIDNEVRFSRETACITFSEHQQGTFEFDWHSIYLPSFPDRKEPVIMERFRSFLAKMIVISPIPQYMSDRYSNKTSYIDGSAVNIADWFMALLEQNPNAHAEATNHLVSMVPDFKMLGVVADSYGQKRLYAYFHNNKDEEIRFQFGILSDGEKCMLLAVCVLMAKICDKECFCFWDEPDNYLAISEVENFITIMRGSFLKKGQFFATTHNPETVACFEEHNTFIIYRDDHLLPTKSPASVTEWREKNEIKSDFISAWIKGEVEL